MYYLLDDISSSASVKTLQALYKHITNQEQPKTIYNFMLHKTLNPVTNHTPHPCEHVLHARLKPYSFLYNYTEVFCLGTLGSQSISPHHLSPTRYIYIIIISGGRRPLLGTELTQDSLNRRILCYPLLSHLLDLHPSCVYRHCYIQYEDSSTFCTHLP